ncbi:uncharacterized protein LOC106674199 isoform X2 [Cimex lectularius]|uniref:Tudor domain-containing protein n=1 Tax=Cimex lectularius TaxID=79782 RepID=A0A8I6SIX1_CIMLE|nr:uncharacterized protein LOC106674199 isoform X2 [Cimex lectularius]
MTPLEELTDSFHRGANKVFELAQLLQISLDKIQSIISKVTDPQAKVKLYDDECDIIQAQLSSYDESFAAAKNFITTYTKKLDTVLSVLSPTIRWLPEKQTMMEMTYQEGSSPWSFTLIHTGVNKTSISSLLEEHFTKGMLQSLPNLCAGDFVCCFERKMLYRAVVLGLMPNDRVKVLNVDNNHKKIVRKENIYDLTVDLLDIPAQCMHCCLMTLDANEQKLWSEELNHIFKATLSECKLSVNVIDRIESLPPKFIVEVYGFNEALESEANLSEWICHRVLPEVKQIAEKSDTDDVVSMMREDALDPFYGSTSEESDHILLKAVSEVSHHQSKGEQTEGESTIQKGSADSSKENPEKEKWYKDESLDLSERYPLYFDRDIHQKGEPNFVTNPLNPIVEFNPKNIELQHVKSKHAEGKASVSITHPENSDINSIDTLKEYQSPDETNVGQFYKKNRYCWKPTASKAHKSPPSKN